MRKAGRRVDLRGRVVYAALFAPLVLLLAVALMTWGAERRYAAVTARIVHDYAAIAAWQFARRANMVLHDEAMHAFRAIAPAHQRTSPAATLAEPSAILAGRTAGAPAMLARAHLAFTYDRSADRLAVAGPSGSDAAMEAMLRRRLAGIASTTRPDGEPHRVLFDTSGGRSYAIALWTVAAPDVGMRGAYGVVAEVDALREPLLRIVRDADLLPSTSASARPSERELAVRLTRRDGGLVFATSAPLGATAATDTAGLQQGELATTVDLTPALAAALLVGGKPSSQLPALALMIAVAGALALLGLRHERRARELARLRTRFVANVSHELRTPLAQISMFAETLALGRERTDGERRQFARIIHAEARRLTGLVESVLRFSRGESGAPSLRLEALALDEELSQALASFAPIGQAAGVTIVLSVADAPHASVDRAAFRQVVLNLLDNAVKHAGEGGVIRVAAASQGDEARITVDDTGPGVPLEWRDRIFEPFVRIEPGHASGAGIGLAVVRDLVTAHGGRVSVEDAPGGGARFVVALRAAPAPVRDPEPVGATA